MKHIIPKFRNPRISAVAMRLLLALVVLMMLGSVLTACGSRNTTVMPIKAQTITVVEGENALDSDQINTLASHIASNKNSHAIREYLVAALRGYDMTAEGFDDDNLPAPNLEKVGEYGYNVVKHEAFGIENAWKYEIMNAADVEDLVNCFKTTVSTDANMDFFTLLQHWVALGFEWLINVPGFGSFILGTVYFAIVIEILMLPLGIHQQKNSRKQALLRPKEMAIRNSSKYKGRTDQATQQKVAQEVQEMYQKEGFSPMAGCLPMLLTLPVLIALYNIVINPLKYMMGASDELTSALSGFVTASKAAGGLGLDISSQSGTIELLSHIRADGLMDEILEQLPNFAFYSNPGACAEALEPLLNRIPDFSIFGVNFGLTPGWENPWLLFIPVVTFALYFFSMKLNRKLTFQPTANDPQNGCSNTTMNIFMPGMSAAFTFVVPGAVGLYWGFKSIVGMVKQVILSKVMPLPQFTEADFKAAEKELAAKEKNRPVKKSGTKNPNVRSLHHIDDEDDLEPLPQVKKKGDYVEDEAPASQEAKGAYLGEATLKDDEPRQPKEKKHKKKKPAEDEPEDTAAEYVADESDENNNG